MKKKTVIDIVVAILVVAIIFLLYKENEKIKLRDEPYYWYTIAKEHPFEFIFLVGGVYYLLKEYNL